MKIILVNTRHFPTGGDSRYTFNLAELLRRNGHAVFFFAMQDERNLPDPNADLFVSPIDFRDLNRHHSPANGLRVAARAIYSREARARFRCLLERVRPDLVHVQALHGHLTPSVIFEARARGLPVVWTLHDYKLICPNTTFVNDRTGQICEACGAGAFYQPILQRCKKGSLLASTMAAAEAYAHRWLRVRDRVQAFVAPSRFLHDKLLSRGFAAERLHHVPSFVPEAALAPCAANAGPGLLFMSRVEAYKGLDALLAACRLAPEVRLTIAGAADAAAQRAWLDHLPPNVQYVGFQQSEALQGWLCGARAVVSPSLTYENQPFSILEAFAKRKPVVASNLGGAIELVTDGERGLLVPPGDAEPLAGAMRWMAAHPAEAGVMGEAAYDYVRREHGAGRHYERLMAVYAAAGRA